MNPVNKILLGVGAALAALIAVAFMWLSLANAHLKTALAQAQANGTACHLANDAFTATVARQNKAVEQMKDENAVREKRAQAAAYEAQKAVRAYSLAAEKLRKIKPRGDACRSTEAIMNLYLKDKQ